MRSHMDQIKQWGRNHPGLGPWLWVVGMVAYFTAQYIVALAWPYPFSLQRNAISDLANTSCSYRLHVCSPLHNLMNATLIIVGIAMAIGALCLLDAYKPTRPARISFTLLGLTGAATALIGFFPEDQNFLAHYLITAVGLTIFNFSVIIAYWVRELPSAWRRYSLAMGTVGLAALVALGLRRPTPLGLGGLERVADYTPDIWVLTLSMYLIIKPDVIARKATLSNQDKSLALHPQKR